MIDWNDFEKSMMRFIEHSDKLENIKVGLLLGYENVLWFLYSSLSYGDEGREVIERLRKHIKTKDKDLFRVRKTEVSR